MTGESDHRKKGKKRKAPGGPFDALRSLKQEMARQDPDAKSKPARPDPPPRSPPAGGEDDALLFHRLFAGVEPLDRSRMRIPRQRVERSEAAARAAAAGAADKARADDAAVHEHLRALVEGGARFEVADDGRRVEGRRVDLAMDALRRLRRGLFPVDARLDMHGMGAQHARAQLELFLRTMRSRGERCVLVIHGKGDHSPHGLGVLRGEIAAWLSQGSASEQVAAFATAQERDGGEGAVYVLLRR